VPRPSAGSAPCTVPRSVLIRVLARIDRLPVRKTRRDVPSGSRDDYRIPRRIVPAKTGSRRVHAGSIRRFAAAR